MTIWSGSSDRDGLLALVAAVSRSPIVVRSILTSSSLMTEWAAVRKSNHADAFVLAWIASHVRGDQRAPRVLN